jgi:hypothetical protein
MHHGILLPGASAPESLSLQADHAAHAVAQPKSPAPPRPPRRDSCAPPRPVSGTGARRRQGQELSSESEGRGLSAASTCRRQSCHAPLGRGTGLDQSRAIGGWGVRHATLRRWKVAEMLLTRRTLTSAYNGTGPGRHRQHAYQARGYVRRPPLPAHRYPLTAPRPPRPTHRR